MASALDPPQIERPTYGYYLDHLVDAIATAAIGIGLGLSPLLLLSIGTLIVVAYLILSINVYLESYAFGRFSIGYGLIGPTEVRLILIALNTVVALGVGLDFVVADLELTVFDVIGLAIAGTMVALLLGPRLATRASSRARSPRRLVVANVCSHFARSRRAIPCFSPGSGLRSCLRFGREETTAKAKRKDLSKATHKASSREGYARGRRRESPRIAFSLCDRPHTASSGAISTLRGAATIAAGSGWPAARESRDRGANRGAGAVA